MERVANNVIKFFVVGVSLWKEIRWLGAQRLPQGKKLKPINHSEFQIILIDIVERKIN